MPLFVLSPQTRIFPPAELAREDGLLAVGGNLEPETLLNAYEQGIFPWYNRGEPILWWSPDPRLVLFPERLHISKRLRRKIRQGRFKTTLDRAFSEVMTACANVRLMKGEETWITEEMLQAYVNLHEMGWCHSVETWLDGQLVGGLYGVALGQVFFGESMFSLVSDASKIALKALVDHMMDKGMKLIDCQVTTRHLLSMGAQEMERKRFLELLGRYARRQQVF
jgi:leucyl/phenylalanyl-tRNA--protein transferase